MRCAAILCLLLTGLNAAAQQAPDEPLMRPRNEATYEAILGTASDPDRDIRARVAWLLGNMGRADALDTLRRLADDETPVVQAAALRALAGLLPDGAQARVTVAVPVEDAVLRTAALQAAARIRFIGREALLEKAIETGAVTERVLAARACGLDPSGKSRTMIEIALADEAPVVRAAAVAALGKARDTEAAALALGALKDASSATVRAAACSALGRMDVRAIAELHNALRDESFAVRREAVVALTALADPASIEPLQRAAMDPDYTVRATACTALGVLRGKDSPQVLADRLTDIVIEVREAAEQALHQFEGGQAYRPLLTYADPAEPAFSRERAWRDARSHGWPADKQTAWSETHARTWQEARERAWVILAAYESPETRDAAFDRLGDTTSRLIDGCAMHILRVNNDRRLIDYVVQMLRVPSGPTGLHPLQTEEAFRAAILFKLQEPIPFATLICRLTITPPLNPKAFSPDEAMSEWAPRYLAGIDHKASIPLLKKLFDSHAVRGSRPVAIAVSESLEKLTGESYPVPPERTPMPATSRTFIEIAQD